MPSIKITEKGGESNQRQQEKQAIVRREFADIHNYKKASS